MTDKAKQAQRKADAGEAIHHYERRSKDGSAPMDGELVAVTWREALEAAIGAAIARRNEAVQLLKGKR